MSAPSSSAVVPQKLLSKRDTARQLSISVPTLERRVRDGTIPCHLLGRRVLFDLAEVLDAVHVASAKFKEKAKEARKAKKAVDACNAPE